MIWENFFFVSGENVHMCDLVHDEVGMLIAVVSWC